MEEVKKNLKKNGLEPDQIFNSAAKGSKGKIQKEEIKKSLFKLVPGFPRDIFTDLMYELPDQVSKEQFLVFFGEGNKLRQEQKKGETNNEEESKSEQNIWVKKFLSILKSNNIDLQKVIKFADRDENGTISLLEM